MGYRSIYLAVLAATGLVLTGSAEAHPIPFSYLDLRVEEGEIEASLVAHIIDLAYDLEIVPPERLLDPAVAAQHAGAMAELVERRLQLASGQRSFTPDWLPPEVLPDRQSVRLRFRYGLDERPGMLAVGTVLFPYDPRHQTFLNVYESG